MNIARACRSLGVSVAIMCCLFGLVAIIRYVALHATPIYSVIFILVLMVVCIAVALYLLESEYEKQP